MVDHHFELHFFAYMELRLFFSCSLYYILTFWKLCLHSVPLLRREIRTWRWPYGRTEDRTGRSQVMVHMLWPPQQGCLIWGTLGLSFAHYRWENPHYKNHVLKCCETWICHNPSIVHLFVDIWTDNSMLLGASERPIQKWLVLSNHRASLKWGKHRRHEKAGIGVKEHHMGSRYCIGHKRWNMKEEFNRDFSFQFWVIL